MNERASECVIALAQLLIETMQRVDPGWRHAFLRIDAEEGAVGARSSYVSGSGVHLLGAVDHQDLYRRGIEIGEQLRAATRQEDHAFKVCLLMADAAFNYAVKFDYEDAGRWMITRMGDATGVPAGIGTSDLESLGRTAPLPSVRRPWYKFW